MKFLKENPGQIITRYDFCGLFKKAYYTVCTMNNAASAFRATGIHPLNPAVVPPDVYGPSTTSQLMTQQNIEPDQFRDTSDITLESTDTNDPTNDIIASTSSTENEPPVKGPLQDLFQIPRAYKAVNNGTIKKTRRITSARCLTAAEVIEEIEAKENEKKQKEIDKENRLKQRELKKMNKPITKGKSKAGKCSTKPLSQAKGANETNSSENYCEYCNGYYFDDESDDEDWIKCQAEGCTSWYHESCTGVFGKSLSQFICKKHI